MEWTNDMVLEFLHNYEAEPVLWDPKHPQRKRKHFIYEAWERIQRNLTWVCQIDDLKKKKDSLMAYYRSHCNKIKKMKLEPGVENVYATSWFAFDSMHSFLSRVYDLDCDKTFTEEVFQEVSPRRESTDSEDSDNQGTPKIRVVPAKRKVVQVVKKYADECFMPQADNNEENTKNYCDMYGALLAQKLLRLDEEDRLILMNQIDNLVFETTLHVRKKKRGGD